MSITNKNWSGKRWVFVDDKATRVYDYEPFDQWEGKHFVFDDDDEAILTDDRSSVKIPSTLELWCGTLTKFSDSDSTGEPPMKIVDSYAEILGDENWDSSSEVEPCPEHTTFPPLDLIDFPPTQPMDYPSPRFTLLGEPKTLEELRELNWDVLEDELNKATAEKRFDYVSLINMAMARPQGLDAW